MSLILSIDVGTSGTKGLLLDEALAPLGAIVSRDTPLERDASGRAEHDPSRLREAFVAVCREAIGGRGDAVGLVVVTSYQFGLVLADTRGVPLTKISTFVDTRAQHHHPAFAAAVDLESVSRRTGCPPLFQYPTVRLHRMAGLGDAVLRQTRHVWDSKAFLLHMLTGRAVTDHSTANSLGCLDLDGRWDAPLIAAVGCDVAWFPEVVDGTTARLPLRSAICDELGLRPGTEVAVGLYDGAALAAALSGFAAGIAVGNFGTSGMFRLPMHEPVEDHEAGLVQSCPLRPGLFFNGAGINNATSASNWYLREILAAPVERLRKPDLSEPGSRGVVCFPYLSGERDPGVGLLGSGSFFGIRETTTADDLGRAILEGVACSFLLVKRRLDPQGRIGELRVGGGGTANLPWMTILANVLDLPVRISGAPEMGIVGAAGLAVCRGDLSALEARARELTRESRLIEPDPPLVARYREIADRAVAMRRELLPVLRAYHGMPQP